MDLSDGPGAGIEEGDSDYIRFLRRERVGGIRQQMAHGIEGESCRVRAWHMDERYHVANWATECAIDFLERRDPTRPFFLNVSYFHPHPPITPPQFYYDRYLRMNLPEPKIGDWARLYSEPQLGKRCNDPRQHLTPEGQRQYRAAYYGAINHIDDQIQRLFNALGNTRHVDPSNTLVLFTSDHGDMLGDHQWHRKSVPYQGAVRVPLLVWLPERFGAAQSKVIDRPVELMDIMPTILDVAGVPIPETVEGRSVLPLIRGEDHWRDYVHGEISEVPTLGSGMHYLTDGRRKYIWFPVLGREEFFDLETDPDEMHELSGSTDRQSEIRAWRERLIDELAGRPENFTDGRLLRRLPGPTPVHMPDAGRGTNPFMDDVRQ
jgi:arylsulfatase A-like enzyme